MNCADFENVVHELAREEAREVLGDAATVMARFHAETCEACAARLAEARMVAQALQDAAENAEGLEAPERLEARLVAAFREHQRSLQRERYRERRVRLRWAEWMGLAAAAVVLVGVGAWVFSHGHARVTKTSSSTVVASAVNAGANGGAQQAAGVESAAAEEVGFVPVPYGEGLSGDDSGLVVRVSMTRSALGSLGYPVDEMDGGDVIQADLLVGEDGWPRAVRLVQQGEQ
jgi:anti-sigma factor RsiW